MDEVVLVTGASSGIGRATARQAAAEGDHVVLVARGAGPLEDAAAECRAAGAASARVLPLDIGDAVAVQAAVDQVLAEHGRIDVVVNSAGVVAYGRFEDVPAEVFERVLRTNALGSANIARAVLPGMRARNAGTLVLIGSLIGQIAPPYMSSYSVSKWAVRNLARELLIENRDRSGVHVCLVSPGGVDTPIYVQAGNYLGQIGRPPPPVVSPEKVARVALAMRQRPRAHAQVGVANSFMLLGFTLLPKVFDAIVTPMFTNAAVDRRRPTDAGPGNVLGSVPAGNRLRGNQGSPVLSILGSLWVGLTSASKRLRSTDGSQES